MLKWIDICFGRRVCAWCKKDLGWWPGSGESHGICKDCKKALGY